MVLKPGRGKSSIMPRKFREVLRTLLKKRVAPLLRLRVSIAPARRLTGNKLLADAALVGHIKGVVKQAHHGGAVGCDDCAELKRAFFKVGVVDDLVDHAHCEGFFGAIFFFQAEDGIRDGRVTGVQTCALPIWARCRRIAVIRARPEPVGAGSPTARPAAAARRCSSTPGFRGIAVWCRTAAGGPALRDRKSVV